MVKRAKAKRQYGRDPETRLHRACIALVKKIGGNVVVSGPISIMTRPLERKEKFFISIGCFGQRPTRTLDTLETKPKKRVKK